MTIIQNKEHKIPLNKIYYIIYMPLLLIFILDFQGNVGNALGSFVKGSRSLGKQLGISANQVARSSANLANHAAKGFVDEMDRNARSPLLVGLLFIYWAWMDKGFFFVCVMFINFQ